MWPFKNKKNKETQPLIMVRYTYDTFKSLFPEKTQQDWEDGNFPDNVSLFIKYSVIKNSKLRNKKINRALIATIDNYYILWLKQNNRNHSQKTLNEYLRAHNNDIDFWNKRLIDSGMITTYNVLGIPSLVMLYNLDGTRSEYVLSKETSETISSLLKNVYDSDCVFVPGWITKGSEMPQYTKDIIQIAKSFWDDGLRVRFGKCLEQTYNKYELLNKFSPLYFVVPFVVKAKIESANINLSGDDYSPNDMLAHAMTAIRFSDEIRKELFGLINRDVQQVVSIGSNSILPGQAYVLCQNSIIRNCLQTKNISMY